MWKDILILIKLRLLKKVDLPEQSINLCLIYIDQIVIFNKIKHNHNVFKHFIGYRNDKILSDCCILSILKWFDTQNILKTVQKIYLSRLKIGEIQ